MGRQLALKGAVGWRRVQRLRLLHGPVLLGVLGLVGVRVRVVGGRGTGLGEVALPRRGQPRVQHLHDLVGRRVPTLTLTLTLTHPGVRGSLIVRGQLVEAGQPVPRVFGQVREQLLVRTHRVLAATGRRGRDEKDRLGGVPERIDVEVVPSLVRGRVSGGGGGAVGVGLARRVRVRAGRRAALPGQLLQLDEALVHAARPFVAAAPGAGPGAAPAAPLPALQNSPGHHGLTTRQ